MKRIAHRFSSAALIIIVAIGFSLHTSVTASDQSQLKLFGKWTATPTQFNLGDGHGSTALSSKWAVVGAWSAEDRGAADEGAVQVFNAATGAWVRKLLPPGPAAANQFFGFALALSGDTLVVGAHGTNGGSGAIHLFNLATGALIRSIPNPTGVPAEYFGAAVAISVDFVVAGAYGANTNAGRVDILDLQTGSRTRSIARPARRSGRSRKNPCPPRRCAANTPGRPSRSPPSRPRSCASTTPWTMCRRSPARPPFPMHRQSGGASPRRPVCRL